MSRISSLVSGGRMIRNACGMTIETIARGPTCPATGPPPSGPSARPGSRPGWSRPCRPPPTRPRAMVAVPSTSPGTDVAREGGRDADAQGEEDHERRHAPEELDERGRHPPVGADRGEPHQRQHQPERESEGEAARGVEDGVLQGGRDDLGEHRQGDVRVGELLLDASPSRPRRTIATRISARTAYCTPREIRARLRGLMPMATLLSVPGQPRVVGFSRSGKYFSKSLS